MKVILNYVIITQNLFRYVIKEHIEMDKPDYILNFDKPKNTEIKYINGNWYLYENKAF